MPLTCERLAIEDVLIIQPQKHEDDRGHLVESYNRRAFEQIGVFADFVQDNESVSIRKGTLRGIHAQGPPHAQAKLVRVLAGAIFDVAVDLRPDSKTFGRWCGATLMAQDYRQIFIPAGFGHAFCTLEPDTAVVYKMDNLYNREAEVGIRWDDPDIGIHWPLPHDDMKVSAKDAAAPFFRDVAKSLCPV